MQLRPGLLPDGREVQRVPFDEEFRKRSAVWLSDAELVWLIRAAPTFDPAVQEQWYASLPDRDDYAIWGIACATRPVGVMGIKHIGVDDGAEYFMYLGERDHWRVGIGRWALAEIRAEVASRGLRWVHGRIGTHNERSQRAHLALGFEVVGQDGDDLLVRIAASDP